MQCSQHSVLPWAIDSISFGCFLSNADMLPSHSIWHYKADSLSCNAAGSSMVFEIWRVAAENEVLREKVETYEKDVERLIETGQGLGHQNLKQKLQYHLRSAMSLCLADRQDVKVVLSEPSNGVLCHVGRTWQRPNCICKTA